MAVVVAKDEQVAHNNLVLDKAILVDAVDNRALEAVDRLQWARQLQRELSPATAIESRIDTSDPPVVQ